MLPVSLHWIDNESTSACYEYSITVMSQDSEFISQSPETGFAPDPINHVCVYGCNCQARNLPPFVHDRPRKVQSSKSGARAGMNFS